MTHAPVRHPRLLTSLLLAVALGGCAEEDDPGTEADRLGVGAQCQNTARCEAYAESEGSDVMLSCLSQFKGGYCGIIDCIDHDDCPEGSACVAHDDGFNYCFRVCADKAECNDNRSVDNEANCSANITWVGEDFGKACVPPEGT